MAQPKRDAQNALFAAIQNQAENNMKSALRATEKATLLRELAEAYRLTAGGAMPEVTANRPRSSGAEGESSRQSSRESQSREDSSDQDQAGDEEETQQEEEQRPRRRAPRRRLAG